MPAVQIAGDGRGRGPAMSRVFFSSRDGNNGATLTRPRHTAARYKANKSAVYAAQ